MEMNCIRSPRMDTALEQPCHPQFRLARPSLLHWQGCRGKRSCSWLAGQMRMPGPSHGSGQSGALGRMLPAAPPGDPNRRYMLAIVAIRTQPRIWEDHEYGEDN